jgi:hypothetical protein
MSEHKMYRAVTYGHFELDLPEFNWGVSVSVDTFNFEDKQPYRVFWQTEPNEIVNNEEKIIRNHGFYDLILTWNQEILSQCGNARLFPMASVWAHEPDTSQKKFQASFITSSKAACYGHKYRLGVYDALPAEVRCQAHGHLTTPLPVSKHRSPPYLPTKHSMLVPFQYTVTLENAQHNNYFSEKLLDAFATKTIPIYWGAPNVGEFFNKDGILQFDSTQDLMGILQGLEPNFYQTKQAAIEENYQKALTYIDRTGNVAKAIVNSWTPNILTIHSGEPNVG